MLHEATNKALCMGFLEPVVSPSVAGRVPLPQVLRASKFAGSDMNLRRQSVSVLCGTVRNRQGSIKVLRYGQFLNQDSVH